VKAVIPAAGLGTRFLPATKSQPKEMLPVVDKPAIQYVVEEAAASGIDDILIITGRGKRAIEDHFDRALELEQHLARKGSKKQLEALDAISELATPSSAPASMSGASPSPFFLEMTSLTARAHAPSSSLMYSKKSDAR